MKRNILILILALLAGCSDTNNKVEEINDTVILYREGSFKKSDVIKFGVYCTVAWYKTMDHIYLNRDGTANDGHYLKYIWTLNEFGNEADKIWYDKTCKEIVR